MAGFVETDNRLAKGSRVALARFAGRSPLRRSSLDSLEQRFTTLLTQQLAGPGAPKHTDVLRAAVRGARGKNRSGLRSHGVGTAVQVFDTWYARESTVYGLRRYCSGLGRRQSIEVGGKRLPMAVRVRVGSDPRFPGSIGATNGAADFGLRLSSLRRLARRWRTINCSRILSVARAEVVEQGRLLRGDVIHSDSEKGPDVSRSGNTQRLIQADGAAAEPAFPRQSDGEARSRPNSQIRAKSRSSHFHSTLPTLIGALTDYAGPQRQRPRP